MSAKSILEKLIEQAVSTRFLFGDRQMKAQGVGYLTKKLPKNESEKLQSLTSDEALNMHISDDAKCVIDGDRQEQETARSYRRQY